MSEHPLSGFGKFDPETRQAQDEWLHEEAVVKALLATYQQNEAKFEIQKLARIRTGQDRLNLKILREVTGISSKFLIEAAVVPDIIKNCALDKVFRRFATRTIMTKFYERFDERPDDLTGLDYALVVKCPYVPVGLVLHTALDSIFTKGHRFVAAGKDLTVTMETYEQFARTELRGAGR